MSIGFYTIPDNKIVHYTQVDISSGHCIVAPIHVVQYDNKIPIIAVKLRNNGASYIINSSSMEAWIRWKKPDGTFVRKQALGCNTTQNTLYFEITQQMVMCDGTVKTVVELVIPAVSNGEPSVACSSSFSVVIDKNPIQNGDIESTSVYEDPYKNVVYTKNEIDANFYNKTYIQKLLSGKLNAMPFDAAPKENSPNYITSGTLYNSVNTLNQSIDNKVNTLNQSINKKADKATTLEGYGITDAYDKTYTNRLLKLKLDAKPFDTVPKENSPNYITSGTLYNSVNTLNQSIATKYNSSNIESGTGELSPAQPIYEGCAGRFDYVKNGKVVTVSVNITKLIADTAYIQMLGLPFPAKNESKLSCFAVYSTTNKLRNIRLDGSWLYISSPSDKFVEDEKINLTITYIRQ